MIVLDEQLLGRNIETEIARWYRGSVRFITVLRPHTVIKDDGIPELLRRQNQPTFVTINEKDFWQKTAIDQRFCVVCFTLSDAHTDRIPQTLRRLFRYPEFETKAKRMGKVIRITDKETVFYTFDEREVRSISLLKLSK